MVPIRSAATIILWRPTRQGAEILMGQRGRSAVFMPSKFVFPGGRVDDEDWQQEARAIKLVRPACIPRLAALPFGDMPPAGALAATAERELAEETGLKLAPQSVLQFVFRAITPPGSPRRFDARFFLAPVSSILGDPADFSGASDELSQIQWIRLSSARQYDLPFITEVVLSEVEAILRGEEQPGVPFFDNATDTPFFRRID